MDKRTVFHDILDAKLPDEEKSARRLMDEEIVLVGAGAETTGRTLAVLTWFLLFDQDVYQKLTSELRTALPTPDTPTTSANLEQLPYLVCIAP